MSSFWRFHHWLHRDLLRQNGNVQSSQWGKLIQNDNICLFPFVFSELLNRWAWYWRIYPSLYKNISHGDTEKGSGLLSCCGFPSQRDCNIEILWFLNCQYEQAVCQQRVIGDALTLFWRYCNNMEQYGSIVSLYWSYNERHGVSSHRRLDSLPNRLSRRRSKKTLKLRVSGLCDRLLPSQRASNTENVFIWWRHHVSICRKIRRQMNTVFLTDLNVASSPSYNVL